MEGTPGRARDVLLVGASGFVGSHAWPALRDAGWRVRCLTRRLANARERWPERLWIEGDLARRDDVERALTGCDAALYLAHAMGEGGDFAERELADATRFAEAAARAKIRRIVYLGGVEPREGTPSEHLRSRLAVGAALRSGAVPALELRASMIIGDGSLSWLVVRDLAARLPAMVLPRWLASRTEPVGIDDVVAALVGALDVPLASSAVFDLPGPERLTGREILERTAAVLGRPPPLVVTVPVLTPRLSAEWVHLVARADWNVARQVVVGLEHDLLARDARYWALIGRTRLLSFEEAARRALDEERRRGPLPGAGGRLERWLDRHRRAIAAISRLRPGRASA